MARHWTFKREIDPVNLVLALAALLTLCVLVFQGVEIRRANEVATQTAETASGQLAVMQRSQRAYVTLDFKATKYSQPSPETILIKFTWRNSGATAVRSGIAGIDGFGVPPDTQKVDLTECFKQSFNPAKTSQLALGPGGTTVSNHKLPLSIVKMLAEGKSRGFVCGSFLYRDVFEGTPVRLTQFCKEIGPVVVHLGTAKNELEIEPYFTSCPQHNCFDEDCPDYHERVGDYERVLQEIRATKNEGAVRPPSN